MELKWFTLALIVQLVHGQGSINYTVAVVEHKPWSFGTSSGWQGFLIDVLDELGSRMNFTYTVQRATGNQNGHFNTTTGTFDGLIGDVMGWRVDLGISDLSITDPWSSFVKFTKPFINTGVSILIQKPVTTQEMESVWMLWAPFSLGLWLLVGVVVVCVVVTVWFLEGERERGHVHTRQTESGQKNGTKGHTQSNAIIRIDNCLKGYKDQQKSIPCRLLSVVWWGFVMMVVSSYFANLTSLVVSTVLYKSDLPFLTFDDMSHQSQIAYGGWLGMNLDLNNDLQARLDKHISSHNSYYRNLDEAVTRVRDREKPFAAIVQTIAGEFLVKKECDLMLLRDQLYITGYGIACAGQINTIAEQRCGNLSMGILQLLEDGTIDRLYLKWLNGPSKCPVEENEDIYHTSGFGGAASHFMFKPLTIRNMSFAFLFLGIGLMLGVSFHVIQCLCRRDRKDVNGSGGQEESEHCL